MKSSGIIYSYRRVQLGRRTGMGLLSVSVALLLFLFVPVGLVELRWTLQKHQQPAQAETFVDPHEEETRSVQDEAHAHGLTSYFSLFIPKIDARSAVVANVSTQNTDEYTTALTRGVAHAQGTYFPGQGKNMFLFAHSTDSPVHFTQYNAVFYLLNKLTRGDQIVIYFLDKKYIYEVQTTVIAQATDTSWIYKDFGTESLILQTCDPPGTTWRRLLVVATRVL